MGWGGAPDRRWGGRRSIFDTIREQDEEQRQRARVKREAQAFRSWSKLGQPASDFFKIGQEYERIRMERPQTRPSNVNFGQLAAQALGTDFGGLRRPAPVTEEERLWTSRPPRDRAPLAREQAVYDALRAGYSVDVILSGRLTEGSLTPRTHAEALEALREVRGEPSVRAAPGISGGIPLGPLTPAGRGTSGNPSLLDIATFPITPQVRTPGEDELGFLGPAAGPVSRSAAGLATPLGFAAAGSFGLGNVAAGELGAVGLGSAAQTLGAPTPVQYGAEILGGLGTPGMLTAPGRAALRAAGRGAVDVAESPQVQRIGRELASEAGSTRIPRQTPLPGDIVGEEAAQAIIQANDPAVKLAQIIRAAKPVRAMTERLKSQELGQRLGRAGEQFRAGEGEAGFARGMQELAGELPQAAFEPPRPLLEVADIGALYNRIGTSGLRAGDMVTTGKALTKVLEGGLPTRGEIKALERVFGEELSKALLGKRGFWERAGENFMDVLGIPRTLMTMADLSATLRQGLFLTVPHPIEAASAFKYQVKAFLKEGVAEAVEADIRARPNFDLKERAGLYQAPLGTAADELTDLEEAVMTRMLKKVRGIGGLADRSQRAYVTYLNKLRNDVFDTVTSRWADDAPIEQYEKLAKWLNHATGRGDIPGFLRSSGPLLNATFFAPRFVASRFQIPVDALTSVRHPAVLKEIARDLGITVGTGIGILSLLDLSGAAEVELNPRSPDFGRIRIGNQRIDFWGGMQPTARFMAQLITGEGKSAVGEIYDKSRQQVVLDFLRSKLAPIPSLGVDVAMGETAIGEEITPSGATLKTQAWNRLVPLFIQDMRDAAALEGPTGAILSSLGVLGLSSQTYETLTERLRNQISADIESGLLKGTGYGDNPSFGDLNATDEEAFRAAHPELVEEYEKSLDERGFGEAGKQFDAAREKYHSQLDANLEEAGDTDLSEQEPRQGFWENYKDFATENRGRTDGIRQALGFNDEDFEPKNDLDRWTQEYFDISDKYERRFSTLSEDESNRLWAAYDAEIYRTFSQAQLAEIRSNLAINDHPVEIIWDELNNAVGDEYYELPEDDPREAYRVSHPQVDAALYLLGRVSRVMTSAAARFVEQNSRIIWGRGITPQVGDAPRSGGSRSSDRRGTLR